MSDYSASSDHVPAGAMQEISNHPRSLLAMGDLDVHRLGEILTLTQEFRSVLRRPIPKVPALRGKTIANCFFEDSTRTRCSFELAAKRLSADVITLTEKGSSLSKSESLRDTVRTLECMGVDGFVVRHHASGVPARIAAWVDHPVINGGDGAHEHPTQALVDLATLIEKWGSLAGARVLIVGDVAHSRVARSNVTAFTLAGASVSVCAPPTLLPPGIEGWPVTVSEDLDAEIPEADVVYLLRMQQERIVDDPVVPSLCEYARGFGFTEERARSLHSEAVVMHPGPMNRGVEIAASVADLPISLVEKQVSNGVAVRMAVLYLFFAGIP